MKKGLVAAKEIANRDNKENLLSIVKGEKRSDSKEAKINFIFFLVASSRQHFVFETFFLEDFEIVA